MGLALRASLAPRAAQAERSVRSDGEPHATIFISHLGAVRASHAPRAAQGAVSKECEQIPARAVRAYTHGTMAPSDPPDSIVELLTSRQHLHPHTSVRDVMGQATSELGCCPIAIDRAIRWLNLDPSRAIGRLRRGELLQLARSVHRFWHAQVPAADVDVPK